MINQDYTFTAPDFKFSDVDAGDTLAGIKVETLPAPADGTLKCDSTTIATAGTECADVTKLVFTPVANKDGDVTFTFRVKDSKGNPSLSAYTMTVKVKAKQGDINCDGHVDLKDIVLAFQILIDAAPQGTDICNADADGDKTVGIGDMIFILKELLGTTT
ncbi:MAG TPA: hypothetical protein DCQ37_06580 [Desulfobacteraceae bacterium]|nr:hypothetical protein [Desulfobacteraceae bacterium]